MDIYEQDWEMRTIRSRHIYEQDKEMRDISSGYLWTRQGNGKLKKWKREYFGTILEMGNSSRYSQWVIKYNKKSRSEPLFILKASSRFPMWTFLNFRITALSLQ